MNLMKKPNLKTWAGVTFVTALALAPLRAEVVLTPNFSVSGYVAGSARWTGYEGIEAEDTSTLDMDATKLAFTGKFEKVSGTASFYATGDEDPVVLDAYFTYDLGAGTTVTAGNFLSWLGYEAFDIPNMLQISYANDFVAYIPAYHTGVKIESSSESYSAGVAVVDSVYNSVFWEGDGDLENGPGFEAYFTLKGKSFTGFAAVAYEKNDESFDDGETVFDLDSDTVTLDLWGQYVINSTTLAAEACWSSTNSDIEDSEGYFWLVLAKQPLTESVSLVGRVSGGTIDYDTIGDDPEFYKYTVAPTVALTPNLDLVAELTYTDYQGDTGTDSATFVGVQGRFKF